MKILSWNVNGLRSIYKKNLLSWFNKNQADFYCFQEIKVNFTDLPAKLKKLPEYYSYYNFAQKKGYSGVAIYAKRKPLKISRHLGHFRFDQEGRFLRLDYPEFILLNLYMPQGDRSQKNIPYKLEIYDLLLKYLQKIKEKSLIFIGDFNIAHQEIDLARPKYNKKNTMFTPAERQKLTNFTNNGFIDTYRQLHPKSTGYSWWPYAYQARRRNIGWRLDYCFVSSKLKSKIKKAYILNKKLGSDHCPIGLEIKI
jgi:exodeoxyribonuclease-3